MALRIRKTGEILCAAHTDPEEGDTYIHDGIHYYLSVLTKAITASDNHDEDNLWFWNISEDMKDHYDVIKQKTMKTIEEIKAAYSQYWETVEKIIDEEGWVYTKEAPHLLDAYFESNTGKQIEFQKSFGKSGENPNWLTKGSRWRPIELS